MQERLQTAPAAAPGRGRVGRRRVPHLDRLSGRGRGTPPAGVHGQLEHGGWRGRDHAGSAVGALTSTVLSPTALDAWGWRLPFLVGLGVGLSGLYLLPSPARGSARGGRAAVPRSPVREAFRTQWRAMLRVAGVSVLNATGFYTVFVYAVTYMEQIVHVRAAEALDLNTLNMGILVLVMPAAGALSDRLGRKPVLLGSALCLLVLAWPLFWLIHHPAWSLMLLGQFGFAVLVGLYLGRSPP